MDPPHGPPGASSLISSASRPRRRSARRSRRRSHPPPSTCQNTCPTATAAGSSILLRSGRRISGGYTGPRSGRGACVRHCVTWRLQVSAECGWDGRAGITGLRAEAPLDHPVLEAVVRKRGDARDPGFCLRASRQQRAGRPYLAALAPLRLLLAAPTTCTQRWQGPPKLGTKLHQPHVATKIAYQVAGRRCRARLELRGGRAEA